MRALNSDVIIIGAGIGGPTLGLMLEEAGIRSRIYESTPEIKSLGVGINIQPRATKELAALGLESALAALGVAAEEGSFYNRFGQLIYREPLGRFAGAEWPQFSIHRGDLQKLLVDTFVARAGAERLLTGWRCTRVEQDSDGVTVHFEDPKTGEPLPPQRGRVAIACDGIHSAVRKQMYPDEGTHRYSGINMWRGVTRWKPYLTGASIVRIGWFKPGKMVIYPIRNAIDAEGRQLVNWVAEIETPKHERRDWNRAGRIEDFIAPFEDWHFDWLDVPALIRNAETILEFPMIDQEPVERWSVGRITLLGDAAHPMLPRGANGAAQAILDCRALTECLKTLSDPVAALQAYEERRLGPTTDVVLMNRKHAPDAILGEVYERTGDKPFDKIEDVISQADLAAHFARYRTVTTPTR